MSQAATTPAPPATDGLRATGVRVEYARAATSSARSGDLTVVALQGVDLDLHPGQFLAVTGPSGAGKTSLLWALAGALVPAAGTVALDGSPIGDRAQAAARGVAIVPQGNALATSLTAYENVVVPLLALGVPPTEAAERATAALELVGLDESGQHLVEELSGGQQQRVALARGFAAQATVLLADEPTSDLDAGNRTRMVTALREQAARGAVVVMATHDPEAAAEADGELALDEGHPSWRRALP